MLKEHLKDHYHSAWHATRVNDAAILNKGNSRWTNYYIEGINWLAKNQEIDGVIENDPGYFSWIMKSDFPNYTKKILNQLRLNKLNNKL